MKDCEVISDIINESMDAEGITGFHDLPINLSINLSICTNVTYTTDECIITHTAMFTGFINK